MKANKQLRVAATAVAALALPALCAAQGAAQAPVIAGEVTPKLYFFDYGSGSDKNTTQFLERYDYQRGTGRDNRGGAYFDLDLEVRATDAKRDVFVLERKGFGAYNHRGTVSADSDWLGLTGYYSRYRSATGGFGFLFNPDQVPGGTDPRYNVPANTNSGFVAQFNNDAPGTTQYTVDRTTYGLGMRLKPSPTGAGLAAALNYDGYRREGNAAMSWVAGGSDVTGGAARVLQRWRGFDMPINERMNRYTLNLIGSPGGLTLSYEGSLERFDNHARDVLIGDFAGGFAGFLSPASAGKPLHFVPDSRLMSNQLRLNKRFGATSLAAGYGLSILDQDSQTAGQMAAGFQGKVTTSSAFAAVTSNAIAGVGLEASLKFLDRDNDSTFPAAGLISATADQTLGVRLNRLRSLDYGVAATLRPSGLKSTLTVGWKQLDKDRDLTWTSVKTTAPLLNGIQPQQSLYRDRTRSSELYANLVSRPMPGVIFRLTPSYLWSSDTGLSTEPTKALGIKSKLTYTAPNGAMVSGYLNYRNRKNNDGSFADIVAAGVFGPTAVSQDTRRTQQSAGLAVNWPIGEWIQTTASLSWMRDDFTTYYVTSSRRRFEAPNNTMAFLVRDRPNYDVDTLVLSLGGDWQASDAIRYDVGYTYTRSNGQVAGGVIGAALPSVDASVDNAIHSLALGVSYTLRKSTRLKLSYFHDRYVDKAYSSLSGRYHTLMLGASVGF